MRTWCSKKIYFLFCLIFGVVIWSCTTLTLANNNQQPNIVTTAAHESSPENAVVGQVIQNQQSQNKKNTASSSSDGANQKAPQVESDLQEGQTTRTLPSFTQPVIDQSKLLNQSQLRQLSNQIIQLNKQAKAQIGIVIVPTTGQEDIFDFAMRIANEWKLGTKKQDNGIVIAVAVNDRRIQILTGYGLEGVLPDAITSRIIRNQITPEFKSGNMAQGLLAGVSEIERILNLDPEIAQQAAEQLKQKQEQALHEQEAKDQMLLYTAIILVIGVFASSFFGHRLTASVGGVAAVTAGIVTGASVLVSLLLGLGVFFLLVTSLAQVLLQLILSAGGRGGGDDGGDNGYDGGGGGFGGGGASGSW